MKNMRMPWLWQKKWLKSEQGQVKPHMLYNRYEPTSRKAIGNAIEVKEAIETLSGNGPKDLLEVSLTLASYMVLGAERQKLLRKRKILQGTIESKSALDKMAEFIRAQGRQ